MSQDTMISIENGPSDLTNTQSIPTSAGYSFIRIIFTLCSFIGIIFTLCSFFGNTCTFCSIFWSSYPLLSPYKFNSI